jgi:hypothetical protein
VWGSDGEVIGSGEIDPEPDDGRLDRDADGKTAKGIRASIDERLITWPSLRDLKRGSTSCMAVQRALHVHTEDLVEVGGRARGVSDAQGQGTARHGTPR